ncbi:cupredoxin domain-containing protein [Noviherbaspirillum aerium]|uniref:cupredoxin domain-containing protein n=1 Tax=Noviherbaspirillum aerium TaxID=2588497 RepID=UPI001CEFA010|nr:cupredoxin family copper-binding protein [Noviherbaspirillum aerium]
MNESMSSRRYDWWRHEPASSLFLVLLTCTMPVKGYAEPPAAVHTATIEAMQFSPASLEISVGDRVTWKNADPFPHTATAVGQQFDSGIIAAGETWTWTSKRKGIYPYICTLHPGMKGTITVK